MAHYGLLPDFLQDMRNQGLAIADFAPLFRSAGDYVELWEKCQRRAAALGAHEAGLGAWARSRARSQVRRGPVWARPRSVCG